MQLNRTLKLYSPTDAPTLGDGWDVVTTEQFNAWLAAGNNADAVVLTITPCLLRKWLRRNSIDPATIPSLIEQLIPAGIARDDALDEWEFATVVERTNGNVLAVAAYLGRNVDDVFREASAL
jgi:hypothetical protein